MIDPHKITNFERSDDELLEFWLFCMFVAGKRADVQAQKLFAFTQEIKGVSELLRIKEAEIGIALRKVKAGKYALLETGIRQTVNHLLANPNFLRLAHVDQLSSIFGVGPKSARFFLVHSRPNQQLAVLDTHILAYLRSRGVTAPKSTPSSRVVYLMLEQRFLSFVEESGLSVAEFDLQLWKERTKSKEESRAVRT